MFNQRFKKFYQRDVKHKTDDNTISLSRHEQVCSIRLRFEMGEDDRRSNLLR